MDVRLPDGTIVRNVPEDITQEDLMGRVQAFQAEGMPAARAPAPSGVLGYLNETAGNAPQDILNIAQGAYNVAANPRETAQALLQAGAHPLDTASAIGSQALKGVGQFVQHPLETFKQAPVSTALNVGMIGVPLARGAVQAARLPGAIAETLAKPEPGLAPTLRAEAQAAKEAGYAGSKAAAEAQYNPEAFTTFMSDVRSTLQSEGYKPKFERQFGNLNDIMTTLEEHGAKPLPEDITKIKKPEQYQPKPLSLGDVEALRREIGTLYKKGSPDEKRLATILTNKFDEFWENPANALPGFEGGIAQGAGSLRSAIDRTHELFQDRVVSSIVKKAESASDFSASLKKQFSKIAEDDKKIGRFTPDQQAIIRDIAEGNTTSPWVSELAALAPGLRGRKVASIGEAALAFSHPYIAGGIAFAGKGAQLAANRAARQAVNRLAETTFKSKNAMAPK